MTINTNPYKQKLENEKAKLQAEIAEVSKKNQGSEIDRADEQEVADTLDTLETSEALEGELDVRLDEVNAALEKIKKGTYGICEVGGEPIEEERLHANPAAKTCKLHMNTSPVI